MERIDKIFEQWARIYKPLSHSADPTQKHKTFYRVDTLNAENEFVRNVNTAASPCMAHSTLVDAKLLSNNDKIISYLHTEYFLIKQRTVGNRTTFKSDDEAATECKVDLAEICEDFMAFLQALNSAANKGLPSLTIGTTEDGVFLITGNIRNTLRGIDLTTCQWGSLPQFKSGWWIFAFQFEVKQPRPLCISTVKYK